MKIRTKSSMFLDPTCANEISNIIKGFKDKTSCGYDGLPMFIIKRLNMLISEPFAHICNLTFQTGIFPEKMKVAKIVPLFKTGDSSLCANYRPILLLPQFSKILEKLFNNRLTSYLKANRIFYNGQYGFCKDHSTALVLMDLVEHITNCVDTKRVTIGVFVDLKKVFDTINHKILLNKLEMYGIRDMALEWLQNYLSERQQYVNFQGVNSEK